MRLNGQERDKPQQTATTTVAKKNEISLEDDEASSTEANKANQARAISETPAQAQAQPSMEDETIQDVENISYKPSDTLKKLIRAIYKQLAKQ
ncbi:hypothetical protein ACHAPV_000179 [Trichoderma viride]